MSLPRFLDRVLDATAPVLAGLDRQAVQTKLEQTSLTLIGGDRCLDGPSHDGFLLAANLAGRLYPRLVLAGPDDLVEAARQQVLDVNPRIDVTVGDAPTSVTLGYEAAGADVEVFARGWNVFVDSEPPSVDGAPATPAALAAAAIGLGEIFRIVFAEALDDRARRGAQPGALNLVTLGGPTVALPVPCGFDIGDVRLVGAGAIGQAAALTLATAGAHGNLIAIDPERIALSNLQRYVLTRDADVEAVKVELLRDRIDGLRVTPVPSPWHAALVETQMPTLVALDSPEDRISTQASLPGPIYNAWTQPADIGWSRHEHFGSEPCLACLYWPERERPSRHEQIAVAFRQHPLRMLAYLVHRLPIGLPLPGGGIPEIPDLPAPPDAQEWVIRPLVDDLAAEAGIDPAALADWRGRTLADVYQDGICGGALLHLNVGNAPQDVLVPLAHQSALAGIMLAVQLLVAGVPALRDARVAATESRFDVLAGFPQVLARPREQTPACLCSDSVFLDVYRAKVQNGTTTNDVATPSS